jgi:dienelactone hydrolase
MKRIACTLLFALAAVAARAAWHEDIVEVPVTVRDLYGKSTTQPITVTVFSDDANAQPAPVLVLNHGRAPEAAGRAALGRARFGEASSFFVRQGFIVAVPTRVGYGTSGGPDVEYSGTCESRRYAPGYAAAAQQTLAVLEAVRQRPDAARDRAVVVGQSYGGMTSVAVAALNPAGVQATINFAGGGGGNPRTQPQRPCSPAALEALFAEYGRSARLPSLWIYTENDMYFGPEYPRRWHAAFAQAGGRSEFVQFPAHGADGHALFTRFPAAWQPRVLQFLQANGFGPAAAAR